MSEKLPTITFKPFEGSSLRCDCDRIVSLEVFADGEYYCFACPTCVTTIPGYYQSLNADDLTNIWDVRYGTDGIGLSAGHIYALSFVQARENAKSVLTPSAIHGGYSVHRLRARDIARMARFVAAPDFRLEVPPCGNTERTDDMRNVVARLRKAAPPVKIAPSLPADPFVIPFSSPETTY